MSQPPDLDELNSDAVPEEFACPYCGADLRNDGAMVIIWTRCSSTRYLGGKNFVQNSGDEECDKILCEECGNDVQNVVFEEEYEGF